MKQAIGLVYNDNTQKVFKTVEELAQLPKIYGVNSTCIYKRLFPIVEKETISRDTRSKLSKDEQNIYSFCYYSKGSLRFTKENFAIKYGAKPYKPNKK